MSEADTSSHATDPSAPLKRLSLAVYLDVPILSPDPDEKQRHGGVQPDCGPQQQSTLVFNRAKVGEVWRNKGIVRRYRTECRSLWPGFWPGCQSQRK